MLLVTTNPTDHNLCCQPLTCFVFQLRFATFNHIITHNCKTCTFEEREIARRFERLLTFNKVSKDIGNKLSTVKLVNETKHGFADLHCLVLEMFLETNNVLFTQC